MHAGRLRYRITFEQYQSTQDPNTGEIIKQWRPVKTVWADYQALSVKDFIAAGASQHSLSAQFVIRYRQGLSTEMRIAFNGQHFNPAGFLPDNKTGKEYLTIPVSTMRSE